MTRSITLFALLFVFCIPLCGCKSRPVLTDPAPVGIAGLDKDKVERAILTALPNRGWEMLEKNGQVMTVQNIIRGQYTVVLNIDYSGDEIKIKYVDSTNLDYAKENGVQYIHQSYNTWVSYLRQDIAAQVGPLRI